MRPDNEYFEDLDDTEDFTYGKSRALQKLLDDFRREERHQTHHRGFKKKRYQREAWEWDDDDDDYDSYVYDNYGKYYEDRSDSY